MPNCAVFGCYNSVRNRPENVRFFRFPKDDCVRARWVHVCRRRDTFNPDNARICSVHFEESAFFKSLQQQLLNYSPVKCRKLKHDAVPSLHLPVKTGEKGVSLMRKERKDARANKKLVNFLLQNNGALGENKTQGSLPTQSSAEGDDCLVGGIGLNAEVEDNPLNLLIRASEVVEGNPNSAGTPNCDPKRVSQLEEEISFLKEKNRELEEENSHLRRQLEMMEKQYPEKAAEDVKKMLSPFFTEGQVRHILQPGKRIVWSKVDLSSALSLRYVSAKAYRYLRDNLNFPLPCFTTLKSWVSNYDFDCGIQRNVLRIMEIKSDHLTELQKWTVISYDEMKISSEMCVDRRMEEVTGPCDQVQTIMARGLFGNWKQPIFYDFDRAMTKSLLFEVITNLEESGYKVVAQVSDMGPSNQALWKSLGVSIDANFYTNPYDASRKIFVFADVPHLIKLLRNHFLDRGFILPDGSIISSTPIHKLFSLRTELNLIHKITLKHLNPSTFRRQKVKLATQLFSNTVSDALKYCSDKGYLADDVGNVVTFIKLANDFFDVFNSYVLFDHRGPRHAYGTNLVEQNKVLHDMTDVITRMRVIGSKSMQPFQKGFIISIKSLKGLYDMAGNSGATFITTGKLNQDVLESFFSYIRGIGRTSDHPNCVNWKQRFRAYVMGKHSEAVFTCNANTEGTPKERSLIGVGEDGGELQESIEKCITVDVLDDLVPTSCDSEALDTDEVTLSHTVSDEGSLHDDSLMYIAGYVASRFKGKYPWLGDTTKSLAQSPHNWITHVSKGGLIHPTSDFMEAIQLAEREFTTLHGEYVCREKYVFKKLVKIVMQKLGCEWPEEVISLFVRTRTYIRVKEINMQLKGEGGRQLKKKLKKCSS